jgi:hypothetical protein
MGSNLRENQNPLKTVEIAVCGKYVDHLDAYKSIIEAFVHAGAENNCKVKIRWLQAENCETEDIAKFLKGVDGILVPGGFGERGIEGKLQPLNMQGKTTFHSSVFASVCSAPLLNLLATFARSLMLIAPNSKKLAIALLILCRNKKMSRTWGHNAPRCIPLHYRKRNQSI